MHTLSETSKARIEDMKMLYVVPFFRPAWRYGGIVRAVDGWTTAMTVAGAEVVVYTTTAGDGGELSVLKAITIEGGSGPVISIVHGIHL